MTENNPKSIAEIFLDIQNQPRKKFVERKVNSVEKRRESCLYCEYFYIGISQNEEGRYEKIESCRRCVSEIPE